MIKLKGFTLIELVVFIVVISIAVGGVLLGLSQALRGAVTPEQAIQAAQLAQQRMELLLGEKKTLGFVSFTTDPCASGPPPSICTLPSGFSITQPTVTNDANPNLKNVIVELNNAPNQVTMTGQVARY